MVYNVQRLTDALRSERFVAEGKGYNPTRQNNHLLSTTTLKYVMFSADIMSYSKRFVKTYEDNDFQQHPDE